MSAEFRELHAALPWKQIVGMRHKLVHDYVHVDYDLVWATASKHFAPLRATLVAMIEAQEEAEREGAAE